MATANVSVIGFADAPGATRRMAELLGCRPGLAAVSSYRSGEMQLRCPEFSARHVVIVSDISEQPASLFRLLALAQGLRELGAVRLTLVSPWIAYGRQDRMTVQGAAGIGIALGHALANALDRIVTLDAHSPAFMDSFGKKLTNVLPEAGSFRGRYDIVVAPDKGAASRAAHAAKLLELPLVVMEKVRAPHAVSARIPVGSVQHIRPGMRVLIVDDIGDSGRTLIAAADALKKVGMSDIRATVTHATDLSALRRATHGRLSSVHAIYDHATARVSSDVLELLAGAIGKR